MYCNYHIDNDATNFVLNYIKHFFVALISNENIISVSVYHLLLCFVLLNFQFTTIHLILNDIFYLIYLIVNVTKSYYLVVIILSLLYNLNRKGTMLYILFLHMTVIICLTWIVGSPRGVGCLPNSAMVTYLILNTEASWQFLGQRL